MLEHGGLAWPPRSFYPSSTEALPSFLSDSRQNCRFDSYLLCLPLHSSLIISDFWLALKLLTSGCMEVNMSAMTLEIDNSLSTDEQLLAILREVGPRTIEELSSLPGMSWPPVFLALDRLSRSGAVSLRPTGRGEYQVSINTMA